MGELTRLGDSGEFGGVVLEVLVAAGFEPSVQGRLDGGVLVKLTHRVDDVCFQAEGEDVAACLPLLVQQARAHRRQGRASASSL